MASSSKQRPGKRGALRVAFNIYHAGADTLLPAFFATVAERLEPQGAGSRFPALAVLGAGVLEAERAAELRTELEGIGREMVDLSIEDVVSDAPDPAWITGGRFTTLRGVDLVELMVKATGASEELGEPIVVQGDFLERV